MLNFNSIEEIQNDERFKLMNRNDYEKVKLNGKEVIVCSTNQIYEDIIWGRIYEMLEELDDKFDLGIEISDLSSNIRDDVLDKLYQYERVEFVDVYDEY